MSEQQRVRRYRKGVVPVCESNIKSAICRFNAAYPKRRFTNEALAAAVTERGVPCSVSNIKSLRCGEPTRKVVVEVVADLLGVSVQDLIDPWKRLHECDDKLELRDYTHERIVERLRHFPVPLREESVEELLRMIQQADLIAGPTAPRTVLSLEKADVLDRVANVLTLVSRMASTERFSALTPLKDLLDDLQAEGVHLLAGRYVERYYDEEALEKLDMGLCAEPSVRAVLVLRFSDSAADINHVIDRSDEPTQSSWIENIDQDDLLANHKDLAWLENWNGGPIHAAFAPTPA